jgi:hypothetical protein
MKHTPYLDQPYVQGRCAFEDGKHRSDNPYPVGSHEWKDWDTGYYDIATRMEG